MLLRLTMVRAGVLELGKAILIYNVLRIEGDDGLRAMRSLGELLLHKAWWKGLNGIKSFDCAKSKAQSGGGRGLFLRLWRKEEGEKRKRFSTWCVLLRCGWFTMSRWAWLI